MTATVAFGLEVLADEPTPSPISTRAGQTITWEQTRTLLLSDGSTAFGCLHCDYVSRNALSIRPHLSKHNRKPREGRGPKAVMSNNSNGRVRTLAEVLAQLTQVDDLTSERDTWRARALTAEKSLRAIRDAINGENRP